jgi:hypothetical protein
MNNKTYNFLKAVAQIWLPALGTLIFAITDIWHLAHGAQIVGTVTAIDAFLGVGLGISSSKYYSGDKPYAGDLLIDTTNPLKDVHRIALNRPVEDLHGMDSVLLKVKEADLTSQHDDPRL